MQAEAFKLDTSGVVTILSGPYAGDWTWERVGRESGLFTQGYIEAAFASGISISGDGGLMACLTKSKPSGFSDLAGETLARIMGDCATRRETLARIMGDCATRRGLMATDSKLLGRWFWERRQAGEYPNLPPPTLTLADDGKVYLREAA